MMFSCLSIYSIWPVPSPIPCLRDDITTIKPVFSLQALKYLLSRMALLFGSGLIICQNLVNNTGEWSQLGTARSLLAPVALKPVMMTDESNTTI